MKDDKYYEAINNKIEEERKFKEVKILIKKYKKKLKKHKK